MSVENGTLAQRLMATGYAALFREAGHEQRLDAIWNSATQKDFELLAEDAKAPSSARLLSSQILLSKDMSFFSRSDLGSLVDVYIEALRSNETRMMSDWGFLHGNDDPGILGSVFLVFGNRAVPQLIKLLDDGSLVDYERPSPDASGFDRTRLQRLRVKDFAALYLSLLKKIPIEFKIPFDERDAEIEELKDQLGAPSP